MKLVRRVLSKEQRRFIKFCIVGASGVPVNLACTWLGYHAIFFSIVGENVRAGAASLFGIAISIFTNFLLNDVWTWRDRQQVRTGTALSRLMRFYLVSSLAAVLQFGAAMGLKIGLQMHFLLAQLAGIALGTAINFLINNLWTFREKPAGE